MTTAAALTPIATVLLGRQSGGYGVVPRVVGLDERFFRIPDEERARHVRQRATGYWTILNDFLKPSHDEDMVVQLSRHQDTYGGTWAWIGFYRLARFEGHTRLGPFHGAGILALDVEITSSDAVLYCSRRLGDLLRIASRDGDVVTPVADVDPAAIGVHDTLPSAGGIAPAAGMTAGEQARLYIDLSEITDQDAFDDRLIALCRDAQSHRAFAAYGAVTLGNTPRLADQARYSRAFTVRGASEWDAHARTVPHPAPTPPPPVEHAERAAPLAIRSAPRAAAALPIGAEDEQITTMKRALNRLSERVDRIEQLPGAVSHPAKRPSGRRVSLDWVWVALGTAIVIVGTLVVAQVSGFGAHRETPPAGIIAEAPSTAVSAPAMDDSCPASLSPGPGRRLDNADRSGIDAERSCLLDRIERARERIGTLDDRDGSTTPDAATPRSLLR